MHLICRFYFKEIRKPADFYAKLKAQQEQRLWNLQKPVIFCHKAFSIRKYIDQAINNNILKKKFVMLFHPLLVSLFTLSKFYIFSKSILFFFHYSQQTLWQPLVFQPSPSNSSKCWRTLSSNYKIPHHVDSCKTFLSAGKCG